MSYLPWQAPLPHHQSFADDQTEALQADVMRFMAILGLCLMAIFSIVQSLPFQVVDKNINTVTAAEISQNKSTVKQLADEIEDLKSSLINQQQSFKSTIEYYIKEDKKISHQLEVKKKHATKKLASLNKSIKSQQKKLNSINDLLQQNKAIKSTTSIKTKPLNNKKGFSLRFASNHALLNQLRKNVIEIYMLKNKRSWKIHPVSGTWKAKDSVFPKQYYEMNEQTVPSALIQLAQTQNLNNVTWAVKLPQSIVFQLNPLMKQLPSGVLIIDQYGQVSIE